MEIRFAQKKDLESIVSLCKAHAEYEKADFVKANKVGLLSKYLFDNSNELKCLVVDKESKLVGYATYFKQFSTWDACYYVYLDCLFLKEEVRGQGIGKRIMQNIKEFAKLEACSIIQWQTPTFNTKAINFYQKIGAESKSKERFIWEV